MFCHPTESKFVVWLAFAGLVVSLGAAAECAGASAQPLYRVRRWTTEQGLPQNRISCLQQTRDGYLWIGTWAGLARFDGARFTVFDKYNTPDLLNDAINALAEDSDGTLWIGTADGLLSYREHRFHRLTTADGLPDSKVWQLAASRSGTVWLQTGSHVARLERGQFSRAWRLELPAWDPVVHSLLEGADGWLHIVTGPAWLMLSPKADELRTNFLAESPGLGRLLDGLPAKEPDRFWAGTPQGLRRFEQGVWHAAGPLGLGAHAVDFIHQDHSRSVWVNAKPGGLYRWDGGGWTLIDLEDPIGPASVTCMEEDREGNLWVGTSQGLVQLQARRVRTYTTRDGLANDDVLSVCEGADGTIWVGTGRGLSRIQMDRVVPLESEEPLSECADRCVWPSRDGGVWIGKPGQGVFEFRNESFDENPLNLRKQSIGALYEDRSGRLWVGTERGVVVFKEGRVIARYASDSGQPMHDVRCIVEDREGTFWFGTQGRGLMRLRDAKFDGFTMRDGLSTDRVWALHEDADGTFWIGTENGLTRLKAGKFFAFTTKHGLMENPINCILEDDWGHLWLSGLRGIYRLNREQFNRVADGRADNVNVASFGTVDGMESSESNGEHQPAGWKARDGRLWFPTTRGVVVIDPKRVPTNDVPPSVVIEQVRADREIVFGDGVAADVRRLTAESGTQGHRLRRDQSLVTSAATLKLGSGRARVLEIRYTANCLTAPERVRFKYKLEPNDPEWHDAGGQRMAFFTSLRPGSYTFRVKACNQQGVWNEAGDSFAFSLAPHFYERWPFYVLCGLGVFAMAAGVQAYRLRWQRQILKLEQQQALAGERTRIARDLHDELGSRLTALAVRTELAGRNSNGPAVENLPALALESRALAERMRDVIWAVDPGCDSLEALAARLTGHAEEFLRPAGIRLRLELPEVLPTLPLSADARHQLTMVAKEALHNVLKHARATELRLGVELRDGELRLRVSDNGTGIHESHHGGRGLANMRARIEALGGGLRIHSQPGEGTTIESSVPLKNLNLSAQAS